ncbi:MAG: hypothetical protein JW873_06420 [Candidatus Saganbacteria bacterium]|nr:hypothetical protein [Candidatus Saganbacteria bacterium]
MSVERSGRVAPFLRQHVGRPVLKLADRAGEKLFGNYVQKIGARNVFGGATPVLGEFRPRIEPRPVIANIMMMADNSQNGGGANGGGNGIGTRPNVEVKLEEWLNKALPKPSKLRTGVIIAGYATGFAIAGTVLGGLLTFGPLYAAIGPVVHYFVKRGAFKARNLVRKYMDDPRTKEVLVKQLASMDDEKPALALFPKKQRAELEPLIKAQKAAQTSVLDKLLSAAGLKAFNVPAFLETVDALRAAAVAQQYPFPASEPDRQAIISLLELGKLKLERNELPGAPAELEQTLRGLQRIADRGPSV